jgi:2-polyprenyl-3-methyl-5-hydroxy-6-metoxy-1,4-benzoquinol methylase
VGCPECGLVTVPQLFHCTPEDERCRYDLHDNTIENQGYVRFLSEVADIARSHLPQGAMVLDYGCGGNAVLSAILNRSGMRCDPYDPLYQGYPHPAEGARYDAVIMCEVIEHCRDVGATLRDVAGLLASGGKVIIRTQCLAPDTDITRWWYAQDITHVNFFPLRALETAAHCLGKVCVATSKEDIVIFE